MRYWMYISISEEDRISLFEVDSTTGRVDHRGDVATPGRPAPLTVDPEGRFLYVGCRTALELLTFRIDPANGTLSEVGRAAVDTDPCYLATDRSGRYLLSAYYLAGGVAVHCIGADGVATAPPVQWLATAPGAHSIQTDRLNRFAFVPHIAGLDGPNEIFQLRFDEGSGRLTSNSPAKVIPEDQEGPRHFCFHPTKNIVYFSNEQGSSITAYDFDPSAGTLTAVETISTLPAGYDGENTCSQIQITPSGRFLYAPNRGHNSIACYSVDESTGALTSIGNVPTEQIPRAVSLDPGGAFLYVAGLESGRLASYAIDADSGALRPLEVQAVGAGPMWVLLLAS
jgi:6-phosphogluconolactonase